MVMVSENDSYVEVCITMITTPVEGMLAEEVDLTLSTMNGTGIIV